MVVTRSMTAWPEADAAWQDSPSISTMSELTLCRDCGIDAWDFVEDGQQVHEDFYVHNELWDAVCPDDIVKETWWPDSDGNPVCCRKGTYVLCIGCFERRLGRELTSEDFSWDPRDKWQLFDRWQASKRYVSRLSAHQPFARGAHRSSQEGLAPSD